MGMDRFLREFSSHTEYEEYIRGGGMIIPNVSYCENEDEVHYSPYDAEIEYLESNSGPYIDTNIIYNQNLRITLQAELKADVGTNPILGSSQNYTDRAFEFYSLQSSLFYYYNNFYPSGQRVGVMSLNKKYTYIFDKNILKYVNDSGDIVTLFEHEYAEFTTPSSMLLFAIRRGSTIIKPSVNCRILVYSLKIEDDDNVILDMIPVRVGQIGYMYDKVSGQLFGNSGTSNFILGPDK